MNVRVMTPQQSNSYEAKRKFLTRLSLEITPRQSEKLPLIASRVAPGTAIYIALVDPNEVEGQLAAARDVRAAGLQPVPHLPARFVRDRADLDERLAALTGEAGVDHVLVLGGGAPQPIGEYDAAIQLLRTGLFGKHGIGKIGIAGHPEGNPDIERLHGKPALLAALTEKQVFAAETGLEAYIATQFLFDAKPVEAWAKNLRAAGITLPVRIGIPGPATIKTLVKYAALCGVGNSARFIRRQALNVTKLLTVSSPDQFVGDLAELHLSRPDLGIDGPHLYPFGGFDKLFDWLGEFRQAA